MGYPGAKNGAGVFQTIINEMPPHDVYVEAFVGSGAILLRKRPAPIASIVIRKGEPGRQPSPDLVVTPAPAMLAK